MSATLSSRLPAALLRGLAVAVVLSLASAPIWAYVVVLNDGTQIITDKKYEQDGDKVILTLLNGNVVSYRASEVDFEATDSLNEGVTLSGSRVIATREVAPPVDDGPTEQTLGDLIANRDLALPAPTQRDGAGEEAIELPRTGAGFVDLVEFDAGPFDDVALATEIAGYLRGQGHESVRVRAGISPRQPIVEIVANSEGPVLKALSDAANGLVQARERHPEAIEAFHLLLVSTRGNRGGQFTLTPALADLLVTGQLEPPAFFVRYVEF